MHEQNYIHILCTQRYTYRHNDFLSMNVCMYFYVYMFCINAYIPVYLYILARLPER